MQALCPFAKRLLHSSCVDKLTSDMRRFFCELAVQNTSGNVGKRFSMLQYRPFSLAHSVQQTGPKIQKRGLLSSTQVSQTAKAALRRLASPDCSPVCTTNFCRSFVTKSDYGSQFGMGMGGVCQEKDGQRTTDNHSAAKDWVKIK